MSDYYFIFNLRDSLLFGTAENRHKYNWKFSCEGGLTEFDSIRLSTWQLQMAIL